MYGLEKGSGGCNGVNASDGTRRSEKQNFEQAGTGYGYPRNLEVSILVVDGAHEKDVWPLQQITRAIHCGPPCSM